MRNFVILLWVMFVAILILKIVVLILSFGGNIITSVDERGVFKRTTPHNVFYSNGWFWNFWAYYFASARRILEKNGGIMSDLYEAIVDAKQDLNDAQELLDSAYQDRFDLECPYRVGDEIELRGDACTIISITRKGKNVRIDARNSYTLHPGALIKYKLDNKHIVWHLV